MSDTHSTSSPSTLIAAARIEGVAVYGPTQEKLGAVKEVYLDRRSGQAEFVCVAVGGVLGVGEKLYPVPWSTLRYDGRLDGFVVGLGQAALEAGPAFADYEFQADDGGWSQDVRDYYGQVVTQTTDGEARRLTQGASTAKSALMPNTRKIRPPEPGEKVDHLADNVERAESRQEALIDEGLEESFPASDPPSVKRIT
jgi:hypothetical protein